MRRPSRGGRRLHATEVPPRPADTAAEAMKGSHLRARAATSRHIARAGRTGTRRPAKFQPRPVPAAIRSSPFCSTMKTNSSAPITILVHQLDSVPSNTM